MVIEVSSCAQLGPRQALSTSYLLQAALPVLAPQPSHADIIYTDLGTASTAKSLGHIPLGGRIEEGDFVAGAQRPGSRTDLPVPRVTCQVNKDRWTARVVHCTVRLTSSSVYDSLVARERKRQQLQLTK
jgi:hypothetical protein